jgi:hypothetical protein
MFPPESFVHAFTGEYAMKPFLLLAASMLSFSLSALPLAAQTPLVVHEWGTFTTMQGSDGERLSGLYLEEEELPEFVYHYGGFSPDGSGAKGIHKPVLAATVKMETPVIYFYSKESRDISVRVGFEGGAISQWYPQRTAGEVDDGKPSLDLSQSYHGWIWWNATVLGPDAQKPLSAPSDLETPTWRTPRATDANLVTVGVSGEVEKYLFYRGVGNFPVPLRASFNEAGQLVVTNTGEAPIPYVFVYDGQEGKSASIWWTGGLAGGESRSIQAPETVMDSNLLSARFLEFTDALVAAGLYQKEAAAMLDTWHQSYFGTPGLRVFWIVPRDVTDQILPMTLTPPPDELQRVLVGRSEVLSPAFEKALFTDITAGDTAKWMNDRYYLAYRERVKAMGSQTSAVDCRNRERERDTVISLVADPKMGTFALTGTTGRPGDYTIQVTNLLGMKVLKQGGTAETGVVRSTIDIRDYPAGVYVVTLQVGAERWVRKFVKE